MNRIILLCSFLSLIINQKKYEYDNKNVHTIASWLDHLSDMPLLIIRIIIAYGFWGPGIMKWNNIGNVAEWFGSLGIPFPTLNAYLSAATEIGGAILLILGLGTRIISIPLMIVMLVAVFTVHLGNGFEAGNNGFEIPLYYLTMLFTLLIFGGGKISIDFFISRAA